ncbi:MAG TPA: response regulator [Candidatus Acidoferrum sp.]|jgi:CheY-like chemotaxis protein
MKTFVLVVEDNIANQELLRDWLETEGFDVASVGNLQSALNALEARTPQVVLLDVQLGTEDGLALSAWIRSNPPISHIPIIAVTAHAMMADQQRVVQAGCNACVPKPIDFKVLRGQLAHWLGTAPSSACFAPKAKVESRP